ncbi:MAG: DUF1318 domain-containing protein [Candidatus Accumulibacter meliphilus]|jgi:hypothetical protein|uniref:DUF1318 domain-containing protein n=1 Tax=Candidatus Accumulibacter meliphilus TaxID=2211374 RepID=A0A369XJG5_9PROT|nr:MAG: DUF1318 domain-containing protein [Candidatus Accumulibacter meliphilus]
MKRLLSLLLLTFLSLPLAAAPPGAEINLDIGTPPVILVKHTLAQRSSRLVYFYDPGIIGLANDGMIKLRDGSRLNLSQRQIAEKLIDQENPDRNSLIYAIAEGNGGQQLEPLARAAQVKRWKEQFHSGWWVEDEQGNWSQKP